MTVWTKSGVVWTDPTELMETTETEGATDA